MGDGMTIQQFENSVTVVLVTYRSEHIIGESVSAVARDPAVARILVVDNAGGDRSLAVAQSASPKVETIANRENLGFGRGMNCGLTRAATPYSLILNPDVMVGDKDVTTLVSVAEQHPSAAIVGPWWRTQRGLLRKVRTGPTWARETAPYLPNCDRSVNFLPGAAMLLRNLVFQQLGQFFDPDLFMFGEDDEISHRARSAGYELIVTTRVEVSHNAGTSSGRDIRIERLRNRHYAWSQLHVQEKFRGAGSARWLANSWRRDAWAKCAFYRLLGSPEKLARQRAVLAGIDDFLAGQRPPVELAAYESDCLSGGSTATQRAA